MGQPAFSHGQRIMVQLLAHPVDVEFDVRKMIDELTDEQLAQLGLTKINSLGRGWDVVVVALTSLHDQAHRGPAPGPLRRAPSLLAELLAGLPEPPPLPLPPGTSQPLWLCREEPCRSLLDDLQAAGWDMTTAMWRSV